MVFDDDVGADTSRSMATNASRPITRNVNKDHVVNGNTTSSTIADAVDRILPAPGSGRLANQSAKNGSIRSNGRNTFGLRMTTFLCCAGVVILVMTYNLLWTYWLAGEFVPDSEVDPRSGQILTRRRPDRMSRYDWAKNMNVPK